jgi:hypothetical protein
VDLKNKKQPKMWPLITVSAPGINYAPVALTKPTNNNDGYVSAKHVGYKNILPKKEITSDTSTKIHYSGVIDGKKIELTEEDNKVKELYIDGKKIQEDQYDKYAIIIDKIHMEMKENTAKLKMESDLLGQEKEKMEQQQEKEMKEAKEMKEQSELMKQDFSKQKNLMEQKQVEMKKQAELMNKNQAMSKAESLKMQADLLRQQEKLKSDQMELQKKTEELKMQQEKLTEMLKDTIKGRRAAKVQATIYAKPVIATRPEVSAKSVVSVKPVISESIATTVTPVASVKPVVAMAKPVVYISRNSVSEDIISDLKKANIITSETNLSFRLTNDELIVNGVKQPDDIHQKMLKKYAGKPGGTISLSYNNQQ